MAPLLKIILDLCNTDVWTSPHSVCLHWVDWLKKKKISIKMARL